MTSPTSLEAVPSCVTSNTLVIPTNAPRSMMYSAHFKPFAPKAALTPTLGSMVSKGTYEWMEKRERRREGITGK